MAGWRDAYTRAASLTTSPRHVGTCEHLQSPDQNIENGSFSTLRAHKDSAVCCTSSRARGFALATNRVTQSFYFLLLRPCNTGTRGSIRWGKNYCNRNGGREEESKSMERKSDWIGRSQAHQTLNYLQPPRHLSQPQQLSL